jgi:hypothetical protein
VADVSEDRLAEDISIMRLPRLRFTVRRLMLSVALAGLAMGGSGWGYRMWWLSGVHARTALFHKSWVGRYRTREAVILQAIGKIEKVVAEHSAAEPVLVAPPHIARHREDAADYARKAHYRAALVRKYERAARFPWLPVEPDPPEP